MAKDAKTKARAKALYEAGTHSLRDIAAELDLDHKTVLAWSKKDGWIKGKKGPELEQKAEAALEKEAERHGVTKARVLAKVAQRLEAKVVVRKTETGAFSTVPMPAGLKPNSDGMVSAFGGHYYVTEDTRVQDKALDQAIDVLGMKKVQVEAGDDLRSLFQSMRAA